MSKNNGAPTTENVQSFPPKVCKMLTGLAGARKTAKDRLSTLIGRRTELDEELNQLGAGHTPTHLEKRSQLVITLRGIDWQRSRIKALGDKIEELLLEPTQDWLWEDLPDITMHDPDEASLFAGGKGGGKGGGGDGDDGGPAAEDTAPLEFIGAAEDEAIDGLVPGVFRDQTAREFQIGDREALEELVNSRVGHTWVWGLAGNREFGVSLQVRKDAGGKSPVLMTLRRVSDIPEQPAKPAKKKAAGKAGKKTAKKTAG